MPNYLDLPSDIQHLIEKRENGDRRSDDGSSEPAPETSETTVPERRESERRAKSTRRDNDS